MLAVSQFILQGCLIKPVRYADTSWAEIAILDTYAIYENIKANHPGPIFPFDRDLEKWLEKGKQQALLETQSVTSEADYQAVLLRYVNGFKDLHVNVQFHSIPLQSLWAGFMLKYMNGEFVVSQSVQVKGLPKVGDRLLSCGGLSALALFNRHVLPKRGVPGVEAFRAYYSEYMTLFPGDPEIQPYEKCKFIGESASYVAEIRWTRITNKVFKAMAKRLHPKKHAELSVALLDHNVAWLSMPSFDYDRDDASENVQMQAFLDAVDGVHQQVRDSSLVVFDLRGNTGGYVTLSKRLIRMLWGADFSKNYTGRLNDIAYRGSKRNISFYKTEISQLEEDHYIEGYSDFVAKLEQVSDVVLLSYNASGKHEQFENHPNPMKAPIVLLTDYHCFSACLAFVDRMLLVPNVKHIGESTIADTEYTAVRSVDLMSGRAYLVFPTAVESNRARGWNEPHTPEIIFTGDSQDDDSVRTWVLKLLNEGRLSKMATAN